MSDDAKLTRATVHDGTVYCTHEMQVDGKPVVLKSCFSADAHVTQELLDENTTQWTYSGKANETKKDHMIDLIGKIFASEGATLVRALQQLVVGKTPSAELRRAILDCVHSFPCAINLRDDQHILNRGGVGYQTWVCKNGSLPEILL